MFVFCSEWTLSNIYLSTLLVSSDMYKKNYSCPEKGCIFSILILVTLAKVAKAIEVILLLHIYPAVTYRTKCSSHCATWLQPHCNKHTSTGCIYYPGLLYSSILPPGKKGSFWRWNTELAKEINIYQITSFTSVQDVISINVDLWGISMNQLTIFVVKDWTEKCWLS